MYKPLEKIKEAVGDTPYGKFIISDIENNKRYIDDYFFKDNLKGLNRSIKSL